MEPQTLQFIAAACGGRILNAGPEMTVRGISTDSRSVAAGELFLALSGERFDGHDFLADVRAKGASAALVEERRIAALPLGMAGVACAESRVALGRIGAAYRNLFTLDAIAVAGSNGKTSTKELIASVLQEAMPVVWSAASFNNEIGVPLTLLKIESRHRAGVFEAGTNHPGELRPLLEMIRPNLSVITSIGREHLEHFGDLEAVLEEEGAAAEVLPANGLLVIDGDGHGAEALARRTRARVVRVGYGERNDWRVQHVELERGGTRFEVDCDDEEFAGEYIIQLLGRHQVVNAIYAILVGKELGLGRVQIERGLASCPGAKMRLQPRRVDDFLVLDDTYNANADSMRAALDTLERFPCDGRRIAVLGEMAELGEASIPAHEEVGRQAAARRIDCLVAVGRSSRSMADAARSAGLREALELKDAEDAGAAVAEIVRPGDVVLVKASRSVRLERVVEFLSQRFGASDPRQCGTGA